MPTYEYRCHKCGKEFEFSQRITEDALSKCPVEVCDQEVKGQGEVTRRISKGVGLVFNGKGFYITDYANKKSSPSSSGNSSAKSECATCPAAAATTDAKTPSSCPLN